LVLLKNEYSTIQLPIKENWRRYMEKSNGTVKSGYFEYGNVRIIISEHFPDSGKTMESLMENLIIHESKQHGKQEVS